MSENYSYGTSPARTNPIRVLEVKMLTALGGGSGGVGAGFVLQGSGAPSSAPTNPSSSAIYTDLDTGVIYTWNVVTQAWF